MLTIEILNGRQAGQFKRWEDKLADIAGQRDKREVKEAGGGLCQKRQTYEYNSVDVVMNEEFNIFVIINNI